MNSGIAGRRILVVEDEMMVSWTLEDMLAELGCAVVGPAVRVNQALAMIKTTAIDAAVVDVNLNGEMSYAVADALSERGVPFVFSTGYNKSSLKGSYHNSLLLQKPLERSELGEALAKLLMPGVRAVPGQRTATMWDANRLRIATDAAGVALWSWNFDSNEIAMDDHARGLWGLSNGPVSFEDLSARIHPDDLGKVQAVFATTRHILGSYEVEFRILHEGKVRWVSARGRDDDQAIIGRIMFGVFLDVTERKLAEEAREMLGNEMAHRVKNLFTLASALTMISARATTTTTEMARDLTQRLTALNRAHDLVRPVLGKPKTAARLDDLLATLLAPYTNEAALENHIRVCVPDLLVGEASVTTLALIVHELATNSIKYGALSRVTGTVEVRGVADGGELVVTWTEQGGPPVVASTGPVGFGSHLVAKSIASQLDGAISFDWPASGVVITLRMSKARLGT